MADYHPRKILGYFPLKLVSIIIPVYNEEENIQVCYDEVTKVIDTLADKYQFEILFTDNHSEDRTFELLSGLAAKDTRVRVIRFSRNFGVQPSVLTGLLEAKGDAVIQLDCDLQDPPALFVDFLENWEKGYKVVYGVRSSREEKRVMEAIRKIFYRFINLISEDDLPRDAGDFRLVDRQVVENLRYHENQSPYVRGAIATMGFSQKGISFHRDERRFGGAKLTFKDYYVVAVNGILNHSTVPLKLALLVGLLSAFGLFLGVVGIVAANIVADVPFPLDLNLNSLLILGGFSLNALFLGILGEYIARIFNQVKKKPLTITEVEINSGVETRDGFRSAINLQPNRTID